MSEDYYGDKCREAAMGRREADKRWGKPPSPGALRAAREINRQWRQFILEKYGETPLGTPDKTDRLTALTIDHEAGQRIEQLEAELRVVAEELTEVQQENIAAGVPPALAISHRLSSVLRVLRDGQ